MRTLKVSRSFTATSMLALAVLAGAPSAFGAAQLIPEHQFRIGTCPDDSACDWDCNGAQCSLGLGAPICEQDADCTTFTCLPGPICDDGGTRTACELPLLVTTSARLVVRVDDNDDLCAAPQTGCNVTAENDECGSKVTIALRGRKPDASEFLVRKDIDLCNSGVQACSSTQDCAQCLDDPANQCPLTDPVFLCNGQGNTNITEDDVVFGQFGSWLNDMQPIGFLPGAVPPEFGPGIPMVLGALENASGKFCTGTDPRATCENDTDCPTGSSCYAEAEYCVTLGLIRGRCLGTGGNAGTLCTTDADCDSGPCGITGIAQTTGVLSDDTDIDLPDLGTCGGGCPSSPDTTCESSFDSCLLLVDESKPGKEKLTVSWRKGPALSKTDLGNPLAVGGTAYDVCAYDESGALAGQWLVHRAGATCGNNACWKETGKGFRYKDPDATTQGIRSMVLKADEAGKSKLAVKGKNNAEKGQSSLPTGVAAALAGSGSATIQLRGAPQCFSCAVTTSKDEGGKFKAKQ